MVSISTLGHVLNFLGIRFALAARKMGVIWSHHSCGFESIIAALQMVLLAFGSDINCGMSLNIFIGSI
jgi:hypothetical protein